MSRVPRIVISYATAGAGHRRAAEAIAEAVKSKWPKACVDCVDILNYTPGWFRAGYSWTYLFLVQRVPWLWRISYQLLDSQAGYCLIRQLRQRWNRFIAKRFAQWLQKEPPDIIVATHFFPANICATYKRLGLLRTPVAIVVTDWHPHRFWLAPEFEAVVVSTQEAVKLCEKRGLRSERLRILGIPIRRRKNAPDDRASRAEDFGLERGRHTLLLTAGGTTVGPFERVVARVLELEAVLPGQLQLLVVCGDSRGAVRHISQQAKQSAMPVKVFGFVNNMPDMMAASDLIVAKAGGMTLAEALGAGLPIILYHTIPGQEYFNAQYVARCGAAVMAEGPEDVAQIIQRWLGNPEELSRVQEKSAALGRPNAATDIVMEVLQPLLGYARS